MSFRIDNQSGVLDVIVGQWISQRRLEAAVRSRLKAPEVKRLEEEGLFWDSCSDAAIERTRARLTDASVEIKGDSAKLRIEWHDDDARKEQPVFFIRVEGPSRSSER